MGFCRGRWGGCGAVQIPEKAFASASASCARRFGANRFQRCGSWHGWRRLWSNSGRCALDNDRLAPPFGSMASRQFVHAWGRAMGRLVGDSGRGIGVVKVARARGRTVGFRARMVRQELRGWARRGSRHAPRLNSSKRYLNAIGGGQGRGGQRRAPGTEPASRRGLSTGERSAGREKRLLASDWLVERTAVTEKANHRWTLRLRSGQARMNTDCPPSAGTAELPQRAQNTTEDVR